MPPKDIMYLQTNIMNRPTLSLFASSKTSAPVACRSPLPSPTLSRGELQRIVGEMLD